KERINLLPAIWKSTWISSILGVMPGVGGGVSQFLCYNEVKRTSKNPQEFGKGSLEGIAAAEASNNAIVGTALIPLLTLGIPGDGVTALLLGAFILHGIVPGPTMFTKQASTVYMIIFGVIFANILLYLVGKLFTKSIAKIVQVKYSFLGPIILVFCFAGAFAANGSSYEVILVILALLFTYILVLLDISTIPLMLGMILAPIIERNFVNSMTIYNNDISIFLKRPLSLAILILAAILTISFVKINKKIAKMEVELENQNLDVENLEAI
ncbi:MAG: tripartite tricarboxylate transporter permease, partial [Cetobacterium sp.]